MKKLILIALVAMTGLSVQAGRWSVSVGTGWYGHGPSFSYYSGHRHHGRYWGHHGYYPRYSSYYHHPGYAYSYPSYSYSTYSYPTHSYPTYGYSYSRPNYAVNGTLLGALTGGLIGAADGKGWEGAGIGAAAGLVLGSLAENNTRYYENRSYGSSTPLYYNNSQPNYIPDVPTVNNAPTVPDAPKVQENPRAYRPASAMSGANSLFGR